MTTQKLFLTLTVGILIIAFSVLYRRDNWTLVGILMAFASGVALAMRVWEGM